METAWYGGESARLALDALTQALQRRHRGNLAAILFYGSCLRSGDPYEGLVDLYVIVRRYRDAHDKPVAAWANAVLPPNVYYLQTQAADRPVRCKYAVLSRRDLQRASSTRWFQSYIWGRICQPVAITWHAGDADLQDVRSALRQACLTFLSRTLPAAPATGSVLELWRGGLGMSYRTELRAESGERATRLVDDLAAHYLAATREVASDLDRLTLLDGDRYATRFSTLERWRCLIAWKARTVQGKVLSILRLLKALFTFEGGLDYIAWKLERHSGQPVVIPENVRRYPLLFVWPFMLRLYRQGIFK
jgi:hypothetical protein